MRHFLKPILSVLLFLSSVSVFAQVKKLTPKAPPVSIHKTQQPTQIVTPHSISGRARNLPPFKIERTNQSFRTNFARQNKKQTTALQELKNGLKLNDNHSFVLLNSKKDQLGMMHTRYQQYYKGVRVEEGSILLHSKDDRVSSSNGRVIDLDALETTPKISASRAKEIGKAYLKVSHLINDYPVETIISSIPLQGVPKARLVHKLRIDSYDPFVMAHVYVDALNGEVLGKIDLMNSADAGGTAQTIYNGSQSITQDLTSGVYRLRESGRRIETYDATNATGLTTNGFVGATDYSSSSNNWLQPNPALDAHWGMEKTYDFYLNVFGRRSYDDKGSVIKQYLNPPTLFIKSGPYGPNNAGALDPPYNVMVYGLGDKTFMGPVVGLDLVGHEYTHMVINYNGQGGLTYLGESGALNESFADIFGACIEFFSGVNPDWNIGEGVALASPFYFRSLSNPKSGYSPQPDTYQGDLWLNPSTIQNDHGGVHSNSGVQNYWFYLLAQGGSGVNDFGNSYSVTGIGIDQAQQIAYRNLMTQLVPGATYIDAYHGSLQAAEDLYGNPSAQYNAVRQAWYAVGIGGDPNNYCSGITSLVTDSGTISDGSGSADYNNNANCRWKIAPPGATRIDLTFTEFNTEADRDTVIVYDGPSDAYPVLMKWWGSSLPPVISSSEGNGALFVKFVSDGNNTAEGWEVSYTSVLVPLTCDGGTILSNATGSFSDGSGVNVYANNQLCYWFIAPPCAKSVTLTFNEFDTEINHDRILVYDDLDQKHQLAGFSGSIKPGSLTSSTGVMLVIFSTDFSNNKQGFSATYTSVGSAYCSGITSLMTTDSGVISDGSGSENYCNNLDCSWLIQPPDATSVSLNFITFDLEPGSSDGKSIYDAIEIYDGSTTEAPLIARLPGGNLPPVITSTGGSMLIRFYTDLTNVRSGWSIFYTSTQNTACAEMTTLMDENGSLSDGSGANSYSNNAHCSWLIQPPGMNSVTLTLSALNTELNKDILTIYDGENNQAPILAKYSGLIKPATISSNQGSMFIEFSSNSSVRGEGWTASYTSSIATGIAQDFNPELFKIYPNPATQYVMVHSNNEESRLQILDVWGKAVLENFHLKKGDNRIDTSTLSKGIYLVRYYTDDETYTERLMIN